MTEGVKATVNNTIEPYLSQELAVFALIVATVMAVFWFTKKKK